MTRWLRPSAIGLLCTLAAGVERPSAAVQTPAAAPASCTASEYRQFDFWIGDWDVFDSTSAAPVAHVVVDRILDGCALREDYQGANGTRGPGTPGGRNMAPGPATSNIGPATSPECCWPERRTT